MDFEGDWACTIATPVDTQQATFHIEEIDDSIRVEARGMDTVPFIGPRLIDGRLTWIQKVTRPKRPTIAFDVTCNGDQLSGTAKAGVFLRARVEGRRIASGTRSSVRGSSDAVTS